MTWGITWGITGQANFELIILMGVVKEQALSKIFTEEKDI